MKDYVCWKDRLNKQIKENEKLVAEIQSLIRCATKAPWFIPKEKPSGSLVLRNGDNKS